MQTITQKPKTYNKPVITVEHLIEYSKKILGNEFTLAEHTKKLYQLITEYLNNDPAFENRTLKTSKGEIKFSLKKGLFLISRPGTGKSFIFEELLPLFKAVSKKTDYLKMSAYKIDELYTKHAYLAMQELRKTHHFDNLYIDDIGRETDKLMIYGTTVNSVDHLIDSRTRSFKHGDITHGTSNLSLLELKNRYSAPTFSRMFKLFNFIIFDAKQDFRISI